MPAFRGVATQSSSKQISASSSLQKLKNQFEIKALVQKQIQNTQLNRPVIPPGQFFVNFAFY